MTDDVTAAPGAEPVIPAESTTTPETTDVPNTGAEQTTQPEVTTETPEAQEPAAKKTPWFQKRIDQVTAEKWKERERADALAATLEQIQKGQQAQPGQTPAVDPATFQSAVEREASRKLAEARFNDACNATYSNGASEFPDFDAAISQFRMLGGLPTDVLEMTAQIPNGHKVLYALGKDLDEAARVLSLPPLARAYELTKLSLQPDKPKPVSSAPKPVKPIDGAHSGSVDLENASMEEFVRIRNKQDAERRRGGR